MHALQLVFGMAISLQASLLAVFPLLPGIRGYRGGTFHRFKDLFRPEKEKAYAFPGDLNLWVDNLSQRHRFLARGKAEIFSEDARSFTKRQKGHRLSLVSEHQVHRQGERSLMVSLRLFASLC